MIDAKKPRTIELDDVLRFLRGEETQAMRCRNHYLAAYLAELCRRLERGEHRS